MKNITRLVIFSFTTVAGLTAMPAAAALTTFATFTGINADAGVRFENAGKAGALYTIASPTDTALGERVVNFSFLQSGLAAINNVKADFSLSSLTNSPAQQAVNFLIQPNLVGGFSFISKTALNVGGKNYGAGSNLLSGTFTDVSIAGQNSASSAGYGGSTGGGAVIVYTSDFLTFMPNSAYDLSISLSSLAPMLSASAGNALNTFTAYSTGSFSSEPAPLVTNVPEPAVWGMMIIGFGLVGVQARRRTSNKAVTA